jgi:hypothetical protein
MQNATINQLTSGGWAYINHPQGAPSAGQASEKVPIYQSNAKYNNQSINHWWV